jgi:hypothetical protein
MIIMCVLRAEHTPARIHHMELRIPTTVVRGLTTRVEIPIPDRITIRAGVTVAPINPVAIHLLREATAGAA